MVRRGRKLEWLAAARTAGTVDLYDLRLDLAGNLGERRRAVAGPRATRPGEEASDCSRNGADVFLEAHRKGSHAKALRRKENNLNRR